MRLAADGQCLVCQYCGNVHVPEANEEGVRILDEPSQLACPVCTIPLVHATAGGQNILYCKQCHGMLASMDLFTDIVQDMKSRRESTSAGLRPFDLHELDRHIQCPQCGRQMDTHLYGGGGNVVIDDCETCQLNWLDYGELDRIVRAPDQEFEAWQPAPHFPVPKSNL